MTQLFIGPFVPALDALQRRGREFQPAMIALAISVRRGPPMFGLLPPSSSAAIRWYSSALFPYFVARARIERAARVVGAHLSHFDNIGERHWHSAIPTLQLALSVRTSRIQQSKTGPARCRRAGPAKATRDPVGNASPDSHLRTLLKLRGRARIGQKSD